MLFVILILTGCSSPRQMTLFNSNISTTNLPRIPQYVIEPGDILQIAFSATNPAAVAPFNSAGTDYLVREDSTIAMPVYGDIHVGGMTEDSLAAMLTRYVKQQVKEPIVQVQIKSAVVTILGEVSHPSCVSAVHPITLLEAIGRTGGFTANANCKNVLIQRKENGQLHPYRVNLLNSELMSSSCYYLHKGDVVYVAPLRAKRVW